MNLFERQFSQYTGTSVAPSIPSSSLIVLLGLKWNLMKRLERPLKEVHLENNSSEGISAGFITVKCDCDHSAFRDIASYLAWRHVFNNDSGDSNVAQTSRTNFIPNVNRALSPSLGTDNVIITFSSLSDVTDLLGINDEDDFEKTLVKEIRGTNTHLAQVVGCLCTIGDGNVWNYPQSSTSHSFDSKSSVQTASVSTSPFFRIFVGAAPHNILADRILPDGVETTSKDKLPYIQSIPNTNSSVLFEQPLQIFCMKRNSYRAKWRARLVTTSFSPTNRKPGTKPDKKILSSSNGYE